MSPPAHKPDRNLIVLRDWCAQQAAQPDADPLWQQIGDEVDRYLTSGHDGHQTIPEGTEALF